MVKIYATVMLLNCILCTTSSCLFEIFSNLIHFLIIFYENYTVRKIQEEIQYTDISKYIHCHLYHLFNGNLPKQNTDENLSRESYLLFSWCWSVAVFNVLSGQILWPDCNPKFDILFECLKLKIRSIFKLFYLLIQDSVFFKAWYGAN